MSRTRAASPYLLFVDHDEGMLEFYRARLRPFFPGFAIETSGDVEGAFGHVTNERLRLVVSEYRMPRMNGARLLTWFGYRRPDVGRALLTHGTDVARADSYMGAAQLILGKNYPIGGIAARIMALLVPGTLPREARPWRAPFVDEYWNLARGVECSFCGAPAGKPCRRHTNRGPTAMLSCHKVRVRAAMPVNRRGVHRLIR